uniref:Lipoprotein n=1 Tax=Meloidogyne incognita TaxID=6306 RepID=A0A914M565_MELIC
MLFSCSSLLATKKAGSFDKREGQEKNNKNNNSPFIIFSNLFHFPSFILFQKFSK